MILEEINELCDYIDYHVNTIQGLTDFSSDNWDVVVAEAIKCYYLDKTLPLQELAQLRHLYKLIHDDNLSKNNILEMISRIIKRVENKDLNASKN